MVNEYVTMDELMKLIKRGRSTIDKWRKEGMPWKKMGGRLLFDVGAVMEWIEKYKMI